jgi:ATP-dependent DNA helicase RecQ
MLTRVRLQNEKLAFENSSGASAVLMQELRVVRRALAIAENVPAFVVLSDASLTDLATYLPLTFNDLLNISGFGETKIKKYGSAFIAAIGKYCREQNLESKIHLKAPKLIKRDNFDRDNSTKQITLKLFSEGHSVDQIAEKRKLSHSTIEGHLAFYIRLGKLSILQVMDENKMLHIQTVVETVGQKTLTPIKLALGDKYSFSEIRYVIAHIENNRVEDRQAEYYMDVEFEKYLALEEEIEYALNTI